MKFIFINIFIAKIIFFYSLAVLPSNFSIWIKELETEILDYGVSKQLPGTGKPNTAAAKKTRRVLG